MISAAVIHSIAARTRISRDDKISEYDKEIDTRIFHVDTN